MRGEPQIFSFEFEARVETKPDLANNEKPFEESQAVDILNKNSDQISQDLEKEIRRLFRSSVTVQAEISFQQGSIIATGAIVVIKWLGPVALAAAKSAFESEFSSIIKILIKRVLQRSFGEFIPRFHAVVGDIDLMPESGDASGGTTVPAESVKPAYRLTSRLFLLTVANSTILVILLIIQLLVAFRRLIP